MKCFLLLAAAAATAGFQLTEENFEQYSRSFAEFQVKYNKDYADSTEMLTRFHNFVATHERVAAQNKAHGEEVFGITKFADMTPEEFSSMYLNYKPSADRPLGAVHVATNTTAAPKSFDWREHGAVTAVKDQGQCGSCWAFSAVSQVESQWFLAGNKLTEFSPQQVVSCDTTDGGCNGGDTPTAYEYIQSAGGLASEADYPYTSGAKGRTGTCNSAFSVSGGNISGFTYATEPCYGRCTTQDEDTLAANVASTAPASVCVNADPWQYYRGGVMKMEGSDCDGGYFKLNHCVQLVGYNTDGPTPYWIVRNTWAEDWGEDGYIFLEMGTNTCGIADEATFVTIA